MKELCALRKQHAAKQAADARGTLSFDALKIFRIQGRGVGDGTVMLACSPEDTNQCSQGTG